MAFNIEKKAQEITEYINTNPGLQEKVIEMAIELRSETLEKGIEKGEQFLREKVAEIAQNYILKRIKLDEKNREFNAHLIDSIKCGKTRSGAPYRGGASPESQCEIETIPESWWLTVGVGLAAAGLAFGPASAVYMTVGQQLCGAAGLTLDALMPGSVGCSGIQIQFINSMLFAITTGMGAAKLVMNRSKRITDHEISTFADMIETRANRAMISRTGGKRKKSLKNKKNQKQKNQQKTKSKKTNKKSKAKKYVTK